MDRRNRVSDVSFANGEPQRGRSFAGIANRMMKLKRRQSRYERPIYAFWELFSDYSEYSTIHGVRYIGEKKRHWSERLWWLFAVITSIVVCTALVYYTWLKWENTPVIVTFSEKSTDVYMIPFPTITICTDLKVRQTKFNYTKVWNDLNKRSTYNKYPRRMDVEKLHIISPICTDKPAYLGQYIIDHNLNETLADADERFFETIQEFAPTLNETLSSCTWRRDSFNCADLFHEILTDEGICFSFNHLNASELYYEDRIDKSYHMTRHNRTSNFHNGTYASNVTEDDIYPRRVLTGSEGLRLELQLYRDDIDYVCSGPVQSFKILIHSADDIPQMHRNFYRIPLDHDVVMAVRPNIMNTTDYLLKNIGEEKRKCVDADERQLFYLKKYTQRNCQLNQLAYRTIQVCKCALFGMPRYKNVKICRTAEQLKCAKNVEGVAVQQMLNKTAVSFGCLPACRSISYDAEMSMSRFERISHERAMNKPITREMRRRRFSRILITFKDEQFFASRRAEVYTLIDFIANCGGILGLFMGVSILSIVEMIYFATLRIGCSLRKRRQMKKRRQQQQKVLEELNKQYETSGKRNDKQFGANDKLFGSIDKHDDNEYSDYENLPRNNKETY